MKKVWIKGERRGIGTTDKKGVFQPRTGKNGGPVVEQEVVLVLTPKEKVSK